MKKRKMLLLFLISMFLFIGNVKADGPSITCPKTATVGTPFSCTVTTEETVYIISGLRVYKGSTTMSEEGTIQFKSNEPGDFDISIMSEGYSNTFHTATVTVKQPTTTTKTTTTTTTTKAKSDNNFLSSIMIDNEEIQEFSKAKTKYFVEVENDVQKVDITAKAQDNAAKVEIDGPKTLEVGDNEYTITVTAENNDVKNYKVMVSRKEEEISSNTDIENIKVRNYDLNFDKSSKTFYLKINNEVSRLNITVVTSDSNAEYEIEGNENLEDGSIIKITVTAEDESTDTYRIIIEKEEEKNNIPIILIVVISLIFITSIIIFIVIKSKKKNNKNDDNKKEEINIKNNNKRSDLEDKTIEMPIVTGINDDLDNEQSDEEEPALSIDNDENEETRILSYAEREELERTLLLDDEQLSNKIDEELDKTLLFDNEKE